MTRRIMIGLVLLVSLFTIGFLTPVRAASSGLKRLINPPLFVPLDEALREKAASKIDEEVLAYLRDAGTTDSLTVMVYVGGTADLRAATQLRERVARGAYVYETLRAFAADRQSDLRTTLHAAQRSNRVASFHPFFIVNAIAVTAQPDTIWQLALRDDVEAIRRNQVYELQKEPGAEKQDLDTLAAAEWNITQINADDVWTQYGITGSGVLIANIDSGVAFEHPALVAHYAGNLGSGEYDHNFTWYDATSSGVPFPYDDNSHGTHTMGTMVGGDGPGPFADDIGVAPGATWIAVKAFTGDGTGTTVDIHEAFEWVLAPCPSGVAPGDPTCDPARAPQIVNNSWGNNNGGRTEFLPDVQALRAAGIWAEFSAGNNGPGTGTIGSPASFAESFATGATDSADVIASFSSRGPSPLTDEIKPDVVAPGVGVRSSVPGGYNTFNGTSMAGPHSSGLAALLLSAAPDLDFDLMEEIIRSTAVDLGAPGPDMDYGYGRIDALRALQRVVDAGTLVGTVQDAVTLLPISGATIHTQGEGLDLSAVADDDGAYTMPYLLAGTYSVTIAYYGYETVLTTTTIFTQTTTTLTTNLVPLPHYTLSGHVHDAISTTIPITNAVVRLPETPLSPVTVDGTGFYSLTVAAGTAVVEAAAFSYATYITVTDIVTNTTLDFYLDPLPPILLVDDDEGTLRSYSPHVQTYYFSALDANGYNYTYWDIEELGSPDFDTIRQYAAVVWFGGEYGRIKDISDAAQAQAIMDYLDLGGRFFYIAQEHTFYYGDDGQCDTPRWGGTGPCPFSAQYLGIADWIEDQQADVVYGADGNPVGAGLGPIVMNYPPELFDNSDQITGTINASLAFSATDNLPLGDVNDVAYTVVSTTAPFRTVFMATPLEAMPTNDAADIMYAVMNWFGVVGLDDGLTLSPPVDSAVGLAGETVTYTLRIRNLHAVSDTFSLLVSAAAWPTEIWDANGGGPITEIGPVAPQATADFQVTVQVPPGVVPGSESLSYIQATSQSSTPFHDESILTTKARMIYYALDSDQCDSGIYFDWVDATGGDRWDLDDTLPLPEYVHVPLPEDFVYYNQTYDAIWINDHATILFGDDNVYDDGYPSGIPPIPNTTILDPNGAIYLNWGTSYWHPSTQPAETAVYTYHDTSQGRNWFVIEYHQYPNLLGGGYDTMEVILDLDNNEITLQYQTVVYHRFAVVGIENQTGLEGILYVNDQVPAQNMLHDALALHFGIGQPPDVFAATFIPDTASASGVPNGTVDYILTLAHTSNLTDIYDLEVYGANWPTTLWDPTFTYPVDTLGPLAPCTQAQVGVRVSLPANTDYVYDVATVQARSQLNTLLVANSMLTTDNAAPAVVAGPDSAGGAASGAAVTYTLMITNSGNITDTYDLALAGQNWPVQFMPAMTQTQVLPPGASETVLVQMTVPVDVAAGEMDTAVLTASSQQYPGVMDVATVTTTATAHVAVQWDEPYQTQTRPPGFTAGYYVTVRNRGNLTDTFSLMALSDDWPVSFWNDSFTQQITQTIPLIANETQRIGVRVHLPTTASAPDLDALLVRARSQRDETVYAWTMLVTAVSGSSNAHLAPMGTWQPVAPGEVVTYTLYLTNTGTSLDTYTLYVSETLWTVTAPTEVGPLSPNTAVAIPVTVMPPPDMESGWDSVTVLVTSATNATAVAQAELLTVIGAGDEVLPPPGHALYLPLIVR